MERFAKEDRGIVCYATASARILFTQKWRLTECPSVGNRMMKLCNFMDMDKLIKYLRGQNAEYYRINWNILEKYIGI